MHSIRYSHADLADLADEDTVRQMKIRRSYLRDLRNLRVEKATRMD